MFGGSATLKASKVAASSGRRMSTQNSMYPCGCRAVSMKSFRSSRGFLSHEMGVWLFFSDGGSSLRCSWPRSVQRLSNQRSSRSMRVRPMRSSLPKVS